MPGMTGEDSTGIRYAPDMWILPHGGRPGIEEDHVFVGFMGSVKVVADEMQFRIGTTVSGELVSEASILTGKYWDPYVFIGGVHHRAIPDYVLRAALDNSLNKDSTEMNRQRLVTSLVRYIPDFAGIEVMFPNSINVSDVFRETISHEDIDASQDAFVTYVANLRLRLGLD